jgi:dienelactone hydrolase
MIVERTGYFARPGMREEVLAMRRAACDVRRDIGLAAGRVFIMNRDASDERSPDVVWECAFHDADAHAADLKARADSPAFGDIRERMRALIDDFRRDVLTLDDAPIANGMRPIDLEGHAIVPREIAFPSNGRELKGYFFAPPGEGPFPCLVCNHGSGIDKGTLDISRPGSAAVLAAWGIASFLPHRRGYGNSPGPAWREEVPAEHGSEDYDRQLVARIDAESEDVLAALDCVVALPEVDPAHIGVMGSSFGGINTLLAASKSGRFTCAVEFAGAAMNWDRTPRLSAFMTEAAHRVRMPIFFIQAANDYSIRPTLELAEALKDSPNVVWSRVYPDFGVNAMEGHLLESRGTQLWGEDVHRFLERHL